MIKYFIQKEGVYPHGVWWIGFDRFKGEQKARALAQADCDSYHEWTLYEFVDLGVANPEGGANHKELFRTNKAKEHND